MLKRHSTFIFLTNKRIIYWKLGITKIGFKSINLNEIRGVTYLTKPFHSGGLIKVITKKGKGILLSPSFIGQMEANEFIKKIKKLIE